MRTPVTLRQVAAAGVPVTRRRRPLPSVLLKAEMAVSGWLMVLYLVLHVIGNLKIFLGAAALDGYAAWLRTVLEPVPANCIGCGACVAACPNGSASLFLGAKITHLGQLPQGQPERYERAREMVAVHDENGFGGCTNTGVCTTVCPKEIPLDVIAQLNRDYLTATVRGRAERLNTARQAAGGRRARPAEGACPAPTERTFDLRHTWPSVRVTPVSTWAVDAALSQLTCDARRTLRDTRTTCTRRRVWR